MTIHKRLWTKLQLQYMQEENYSHIGPWQHYDSPMTTGTRRTQRSVQRAHEEALRLLSITDDPNFAEIAKECNVHESTVRRLHRKLEQHGPHAVLNTKLGRPRGGAGDKGDKSLKDLLWNFLERYVDGYIENFAVQKLSPHHGTSFSQPFYIDLFTGKHPATQ